MRLGVWFFAANFTTGASVLQVRSCNLKLGVGVGKLGLAIASWSLEVGVGNWELDLASWGAS